MAGKGKTEPTTERVEMDVASNATTETADVEAPPRTFSQGEVDAFVEAARKAEFDRINPTLSAQGIELKKLREQAALPAQRGVSRVDELVLEEMKAREVELGERNPRIAQLEAEIARERQMETIQKQRDAIEGYTNQWRGKLEDKIRGAGENPTDEKFDRVWDAFEIAYVKDGKFERADERLDRILTKIKPSKPEDETFEKRLDEEKRKWMEEHGLLTSETGLPSASGSPRTKAEAAKLYTEGKLSDKDYSQWRNK